LVEAEAASEPREQALNSKSTDDDACTILLVREGSEVKVSNY
jgi:hypothetical protein